MDSLSALYVVNWTGTGTDIMQRPASRRLWMAGGLTAAVAGQARDQQAGAEDPPRLGLIGLGNRSRTHLRAYDDLGNVEVAALSDIQSDRMRAARRGSLQFARRNAVRRIAGSDPQPLDLGIGVPEGPSMEVQMYRDFFRAVHERSQPALHLDFVIEAAKLAYAAWTSIDERRIVRNADFAGLPKARSKPTPRRSWCCPVASATRVSAWDIRSGCERACQRSDLQLLRPCCIRAAKSGSDRPQSDAKRPAFLVLYTLAVEASAFNANRIPLQHHRGRPEAA